MTADELTPTSSNSLRACSTQKPETMKTTIPECMIDSQSLKSSLAVFPFSSNFLGGLWCGQSLPSTSLMEYMLAESPKHIEWYSLPNGWSLQGTNIQPGQVHWLVHTDMDSSRQAIHEGTKALGVCLLKALSTLRHNGKALYMLEQE